VQQTIQLAILGVATGCLYALMASGLVLTYRSSRVLNFAHGAVATFGTFTCLHAVNNWEWPILAAVVLGVGTSALIGALFQTLVLRPLRDAPQLARVVATLGLLVALNAAVIPVFQVERPRVIRLFSSRGLEFTVGGSTFTVPFDRLMLSCITVLILLALWALYRFTRFGRATRAAADSQLSASLLGFSPNRLELYNWLLGSGMAGLAGILLSGVSQPDALSFTLTMLAALAAVLVARLQSFAVLLVAGIALGVGQGVLAGFTSDLHELSGLTGWSQALPFVLVIAAVVASGRRIALKGTFDEESLPPASVSPHPWRNAVIALVVGLGFIILGPDGIVGPMVVTLVGVILALSVVVITGYAGQVSLVQMGLAGVGAWATARASHDLGFAFPIPLLAGALVAAVAGVLIGLPALRVRGLHLAIVTLGAGIVLDVMFFSDPEISGADRGLLVAPAKLGPIDLSSFDHPQRYAVFVLVATILVGVGVHRLRVSRFGSHMLACRSNERGAASVGLSITRTKILAFAIASMVAGFGGSLWAYTSTRVEWSNFNFTESIFLVSLAYIGGIATIGGATTAGILTRFGLLAFYLHFDGDAQRIYEVVGGLGVMFIVVMHPEGFGAVPRQVFAALSKRLVRSRRGRREPEPVTERGDREPVLADRHGGGA
jgi:branched-subunit amino acid ABC-type transport system permease component